MCVGKYKPAAGLLKGVKEKCGTSVSHNHFLSFGGKRFSGGLNPDVAKIGWRSRGGARLF